MPLNGKHAKARIHNTKLKQKNWYFTTISACDNHKTSFGHGSRILDLYGDLHV